MSAATMNGATVCSVSEARKRLMNTRGMGDAEINDLQAIVARFQAARPRNRSCAACQCMIWEERTDRGESVWACASCHRPASLTQEQWFAECTREREAAEAHMKAAAAAAPKPRAALKEALARLTEAKASLSKLERAVPAARSGVVEAQARHDAAKVAVSDAETNAAEGVAAAFFEGTKPTGAVPSVAAANAELAEAISALVVAKNARTILDSKLKDARSAADYANNRARKAAQAVIAAELFQNLLTSATEARATYIELIGQLGWLLRSHVLPDTDATWARQLVSDANVPPSAWPDASTQMEAAMAALLLDAEATI